MSMLGMIAAGILFGLRGGSVPPWIVAVFGGGHPPAAQAEVIKFKDFDIATAISPRTVIYKPEAKTIPVKLQTKTPAAPTSDIWQTLPALFTHLLLIGASFRKSILPSRN